MMKTITCEACAVEFETPLLQRGSPRRFCSARCQHVVAPRIRKQTVIRACATCGREFVVVPGLGGSKRYCSLPCRRRAQNLRNLLAGKPRIRKSTEYGREYDRRRYQTAPERVRAKVRVYHAIKTGKLVRQPCQECGATPTHAHHHDYSKPLDVKWLCPMHHHRAHGRGPR